MNQPRIVIHVHGGYVRDVFCSINSAEVAIVDWDVAPGQADSGVVEVTRQGRRRIALVGRFDAVPLGHLSGTDVEAALIAAVREEAINGVLA